MLILTLWRKPTKSSLSVLVGEQTRPWQRSSDAGGELVDHVSWGGRGAPCDGQGGTMEHWVATVLLETEEVMEYLDSYYYINTHT